MKALKLTRRGKTVRNFVAVGLCLLLAWSINGFGNLTLMGALDRAAAQYFGEPGTIVAVEHGIFGERSSADAMVMTDRGDGNLHVYTVERGWLWLYFASYKGAYPVVNDESTILLNKWKRDDDTLEYEEYQYTFNGRPVTVWIERFA